VLSDLFPLSPRRHPAGSGFFSGQLSAVSGQQKLKIENLKSKIKVVLACGFLIAWWHPRHLRVSYHASTLDHPSLPAGEVLATLTIDEESA